jgi:hypothetical protein
MLGEHLDLGFSPKLSRVAAGICLLLLLGLLDYVARRWKLIAIPISLVLLLLVLSSWGSRARKFAGRVAKALDVTRLGEWLEDRFENLIKR